MGKVVTGTGIVRQALKAVLGEERYKDLRIYTDKLQDRHKVKVQQYAWARVEDNEVKEVVDYIKENYGKEVEVKTGVSGSRHLGTWRFTFKEVASSKLAITFGVPNFGKNLEMCYLTHF